MSPILARIKAAGKFLDARRSRAANSARLSLGRRPRPLLAAHPAVDLAPYGATHHTQIWAPSRDLQNIQASGSLRCHTPFALEARAGPLSSRMQSHLFAGLCTCLRLWVRQSRSMKIPLPRISRPLESLLGNPEATAARTAQETQRKY